MLELSPQNGGHPFLTQHGIATTVLDPKQNKGFDMFQVSTKLTPRDLARHFKCSALELG